jgi:two-component system cell cycle sensor histidine kinase/response regulator CckA
MSAFALTEENLRTLFRILIRGIIVHDEKGRVIAVNPAAEKILGSTEREMKGHPFPNPGWRLLGEDGSAFPRSKLPHKVVLASRQSAHSIVAFIAPKGGGERWLSITAIPVLGDKQTPSMVCSILEDISERRLADAALRESDTLSRVLFAHMHEGVALLRMVRDDSGAAVNYRILDINPQYEKLINRPRENFVGKLATEAFGMKSPPYLAEYATVVRTGEPFHFEYHYVPWDRDFYVSTSVVYGDTFVTFFFDITERKRTEEALRASEERFKHLVESVTDYIYTVKVEAGGQESTMHSPGCIAVTGYTSDEYAADPYLWYRMVLDEDKPLVQEQLRRVRSGEIMPPIEHRIIHKNGSVRWVRNALVTRHDEKDRLIAYDGLISDISERKQAYFALQSSKEYAEKLIETANTMVVGLDVNGRITVFNAAAEKISGYAKKELENRNWFEVIVPRDRFPEVWEMFQKTQSSGLPERFENPILTKHGDVRHIVWQNTVLKENGRPVGTISFGMDITESKRSEIALRRSEEKYRDIFERAVEGIFQIGPDGALIDVNPAFAAMLGFESPAELMAKTRSISDLVFAISGDAGGLLALLKRSDTVRGIEQKLSRRDGVAIWASINARAIRDQAGRIVSYEGTAMDITESKLVEAERERLQSQLRQAQKMEAIGTFIGGVAHDFNNMLSVIIGYGALLQMSLDEGDVMRSYVDQIVATSERAASLTQSLLAFSRKQPMVMKPIELNKLIQATKKILQRLLTEDIVLTESLFPLDIVVMGDSSQIDQILFNLATNARDAMPKGGELRISTELVELDADFIDVLGFGKPGTYALIQVADSGIGMDEKIKEHIFDPFFTTKEVGKGTGLGLSTVYGIVKQHKGYINVYSEPSKGAVFNIYLPVAPDKVPEETVVAHRMPRGNESILVAEDNEGVRDLMRTVLTRYGYTIFEAVDGEDAIGKVDACATLDLMIVDSVMPKKNGREVLDELKKRHRDVKVLFTSGYTKDVVLDKGIEEHLVDFLPKPI